MGPTTASTAKKEVQRNSQRKDTDAFKRYVSAEQAFASLGRRIDLLAATLPRESTGEQEQIEALLRECKDNFNAQEARLCAFFRRIQPAKKQPVRVPEMAAKAFAMPEVLEHIMSYLPPCDILRAYGINKTFYDTIEGSVKLQRAMGLIADANSCFLTPAYPLLCKIEGMFMSDAEWPSSFELQSANASEMKVEVDLSTGGTAFQSMKLGSRRAKTLVSQPPIKEMRVYAHCCTRAPNNLNFFSFRRTAQSETLPTTTITCPTGITMGQVFDALSRVRKAHALCLYANEHDYDADGFVRSRILIEGSVALKADDPVVRAKKERQRRTEADKQVQKEHKIEGDCTRLQSKPISPAHGDRWKSKTLTDMLVAHATGQPIPTLAEFEAAQDNNK